MTIQAFTRYDLRTTDPDAARRFYAAALGLELDAAAPLAVWPLHEQARARGAPAHWLGSIGVTDIAATLGRLLELGGQALGPAPQPGPDGVPFAVVRDPLGAVVAVRERPGAAERSPIVWHQLHTTDVERAWTMYSELFGWSHTRTVDMPGLDGGQRQFAWQPGGETIAAMANTARWPGVHVHWLFYFGVADLDGAIAKVRAHAGNALGTFVLPNGSRVAACEDPQGAAFGLLQPA